MLKLLKRDKWKPKDILVILEKEEVIFRAIVCMKLDTGTDDDTRDYDPKDIRLVNRLWGMIHRHSIKEWEIREENKGANSGVFLLYHYPMRYENKTKRNIHIPKNKDAKEWIYAADMGEITKAFNDMVK